ncbi:hypothetical protein C8R43DRAFT_1142062 [Mycena crocata]|nr:hypothetical protein C8R43DRAFT_1142062 [Mycena crocata]
MTHSNPSKFWSRNFKFGTAALGFNAAKIGRAAPSNMKKVEFYPGTQLMYLVLDAKLLDIWRLLSCSQCDSLHPFTFSSLAYKTDDIFFAYFNDLEKQNKLLDMETLLPMARQLYRVYGTVRGRNHAIYNTGTTRESAQTVPTGSRWVACEIEESSLEPKKRKSTKKPAISSTQKPQKTKLKPVPKPCKGDFVFAQNLNFIRDGLNLRKLTTAVAHGDIGCIYECIKYLLFTFTGSTHTNPINYVLETVMNLELECSPGLKLALLHSLIWNLSGLPGHCEDGDFIVEFFNRLLEDVVEHKSPQFDDLFIRNIISHNLRHIAELKVAWQTSAKLYSARRIL